MIKAPFLKLHLCSGARLEPGWVNLDADPPADIRHDVRLGLPYEDNTFERIYCEHAIEHFTSEQGVALLKECWRVLAPGGALRFSTPDLRLLAHLYIKGCALDDTGLIGANVTSHPLRHYEAVGFVPETPAQLINEGMRRWGHLYLYDELELTLALRAAGFRVIRRARHGETTIPGMVTEGRPNCGELIVEASKQ